MDGAYRHLRHNVKLNVIQGIFSVISMNLFNPFIAIYAIKVLQASDQQVAWLSSLPAVTGILALIPGALFLDRLERKKKFTGTVIFFARFVILLVALIPWIPWGVSAMWLVALMALMNFPASLAGLAWTSFIGGIIPQQERARVFSSRNRIMTAVGIVATIVTGYIIGQFPQDEGWPYQIFFFIAFAFGMLETAYLYKLIEEPQRVNQQLSTEKRLIKVFHALRNEKAFLMFLSASVIFHFGWQMAWPLFNIYQVDERFVNMSAFWISVVSVVSGIGSLVSYGMWGKLSQRWGNGPVLMISAVGMAMNPYLYIFTKNIATIIVINLVIGVFIAGFLQTLFNRVLDLCPTENRSMFIAVHSLLVGTSAIFAPQVGVWIFKAYSMNTGFFVSGTIRLLGALALGGAAWWEWRRRGSRRVLAEAHGEA